MMDLSRGNHGRFGRLRLAASIIMAVCLPSFAGVTFTGFIGGKAETLLNGRVFSHYARGDVMDEAVRAFETHCDDAVVDGSRHGWWQGEYWGKTMLTHTGAIRYTGRADEKDFVRDQVKRLVDGHMRSDGYLGTYGEAEYLKQTWNLWGRKYTLWALVEAFETTGDKKALDAAERTMDQIIAMLSERKLSVRETGCFNGLPTGSILSPLVRLYRHVPKPSYRAFMESIVSDWDRADGAAPNLIANAFSGKPVHTWYPEPVIWAKSYEMMSCYEGLVDYAAIVGDCRALEAAERFADLLAEHEMNALGCVGYYDHFTHAAANENATIEMCDVVYWMRLCNALARATGHTRHFDRAELAFCNAFLAGLYEGGRWGAYSVRAHGTRHGTAPFLIGMRHHSCCVDNSPRGFYDMADHALVRRGNVLEVNYCFPCKAEFDTGLSVKILGDYPVSDGVTLDVRSSEPLTISIRVPEWCARMTVDGRTVGVENGRAILAVEKKKSFCICFEKKTRIAHRPDLGEPAIAAGEGNDGLGHDGRQFLFELSPRFPEMRGLGLRKNAATVLHGPFVLTKARLCGLGEKEIFSSKSINGEAAWTASVVESRLKGAWGSWELTLKNASDERKVLVCDLPSAAPNDDWQNAFSIWF